MFSFLFRAAFWLALVYFLVPFDAIFGTGTSSFRAPAPAAQSDSRSVTTSTIRVRPDGRILQTATETADPTGAEPEPRQTASAGRPSVSEVMGFCDRNPRVCDIGLEVVYGAANKAGDALAALGDLVKPEGAPRRHTASRASGDTLTEGDRLVGPGGSAIP